MFRLGKVFRAELDLRLIGIAVRLKNVAEMQNRRALDCVRCRTDEKIAFAKLCNSVGNNKTKGNP